MSKEVENCICPKFEKTFSILGKKWNGLIIDVLLNDGPQRFKDLAEKIEKCSDRVLVERLRELEAQGIVEKLEIPACCRIQYGLTAKGQDLKQVMSAIHCWSNKWHGDDCNHCC